jgi:hypothetical protein
MENPEQLSALRQPEHGHWQKPIGVQHHCFDGNNKQRL